MFGSEDSDEEEEFEEFPLQLHTNMTWTSTQFEQEIDPFSLQCGPTPNAPQQRSALEYFQLFVDNEIIEQIAEFTNRNTAKKEVAGWKQTPPSEIKALTAMMIISNDLLVVPRDEVLFLQWGRACFIHPE